jgi:hypothetical protein
VHKWLSAGRDSRASVHPTPRSADADADTDVQSDADADTDRVLPADQLRGLL